MAASQSTSPHALAVMYIEAVDAFGLSIILNQPASQVLQRVFASDPASRANFFRNLLHLMSAHLNAGHTDFTVSNLDNHFICSVQASLAITYFALCAAPEDPLDSEQAANNAAVAQRVSDYLGFLPRPEQADHHFEHFLVCLRSTIMKNTTDREAAASVMLILDSPPAIGDRSRTNQLRMETIGQLETWFSGAMQKPRSADVLQHRLLDALDARAQQNWEERERNFGDMW